MGRQLKLKNIIADENATLYNSYYLQSFNFEIISKKNPYFYLIPFIVKLDTRIWPLSYGALSSSI